MNCSVSPRPCSAYSRTVLPDRGLKTGQGLVHLALVHERGPERVVGLGAVRVEPQRLPAVRHRLVELALLAVGVAQVGVRPAVVRLEAERLAEAGDGLVELP